MTVMRAEAAKDKEEKDQEIKELKRKLESVDLQKSTAGNAIDAQKIEDLLRDAAYRFAGVGIGTRDTCPVPLPRVPRFWDRGGTQTQGAPFAPFFIFCFKTRFFARKLVLELMFW
jgi:hypothetical protein